MNEENDLVAASVREPLFYVGVGASAGGLEALDALFSNMPTDTGMAFIVVQHLSPDYKSLMVELLSKRTEMVVRRAEEGMKVEADTVYLIPPKKNLTIFHGKLLLSEQDHAKGLNLPIDLFLTSLATDQAEKSVAIILSGTGSDGARGLRAIKEAGGLVVAQSRESAKFDGMPRAAIDTGLVDIILPPEEMPGRLVHIANPPYATSPQRPQAILSDEDGLTRIFALLRERTGVDFTLYKPNTVLRRIERRMSVNQAEDLRDYVRRMENNPGEIEILYRDMLIGVTSFFRDRDVFDEIERVYMPEILGRAEREVRFWVAGCSTGEEAYTLAIIARETMQRLEKAVDVKIFATDIDRQAIQQAGNGVFPESIVADIPQRILGKYFHRQEDYFRVDRAIREMVVFAQHNLIKDPPFTNISLLSCRNLLIYLQPVLQRKVIDLINFSLNAGGIYLMGTSETTGEMADYFEPLHHKFKIFRCRGKRNLASDGSGFVSLAGHRSWQIPPRPGVMGGKPAYRLPAEDRLLDRFLQALAGEYVPLAVLVNEQMEVLHIVGDAEGYLKVPTGKLMNDISKMASRDLAIPLATGIQKVFKSGEELTYTNIRIRRGDEQQVVKMRIKALPGKGGQETLAIVFLEEVTPSPVSMPSDKGQVYDVSGDAQQRINDLEQELQFNRENLQATIEELETSIEELETSNEELQATNEELLASNEELQSTNEELQSVNEELHTVNAEYQSKITELTELNNDMDNLLASTGIGVLYLDENLEIRKYTPEISRVFSILRSDIGRPVNHLAHTLVDVDPRDVVKMVEKTGGGIDREVQTEQGDWYLMRVIPYAIGEKATSGFVMTFIDIAPVKKAEARLADEREQLLSLFDSINQIIYVADMDTHEILYANKTCRDAFGEDILGQCCFEALQQKKAPCEFCTNSVIRELESAPFEWEHYNAAHKRYYSVVDRVIQWPDGRHVRFEMAVDITDRKKTEADCARLADLLNATQRLTRVGGWEWSVTEQKMFWTDEVYRIHGFDPAEFDPGSPEHIKRSLLCYDPASRPLVIEAFKKCSEEGVPYDLLLDFTTVDGVARKIRTRAHAIREEGIITKVLGNIMDVTPGDMEAS